MYRIRIFAKGEVRTQTLAEPVLTLGSSVDNDLFADDSDIPALALRLSHSGDGYAVTAASPKAKPLHNGKRADHFQLNPGDLLELGSTRFLLEGGSAESADADLPEPSAAIPSSLSRLCELVAEERDLKALLGKLMRLSLETFRGDEALLFTLDGEGKPSLAVSTREGAATPLFSDTIVEKVLRDGKGMYLGNALEDPEFARSQSVVALNLRSVLCCPILTGGRKSGLIYIGSARPSVSFGPAALRELEIHSLVMGCLIDHVQYIETQARVVAALGPEDGGPGFIATCPPMRSALAEARAVASGDIAVLLEGETGTGKDVLAHYIHRASRRASKPFLVINCSTLRGEILASELFGHKKGAFTGALQDQRGIFQAADGGTLFLDEIGEMDLPLQAMLLRTLESGMVRPVGQASEVKVDVRLVSATNRRLQERVAEGAFREDLFYRINQHCITLPPLRERGEDLALLAHYFLEKAKARHPEKALAGFRPESMFAMSRYRWPGNVRELANAVAKAALFADSPQVKVSLPGSGAGEEWLDMDAATRRFQVDYLQRALDLSGGDKDKAAALLGIGRSTLFRYLAQAKGEPPPAA